MSKKYASILLGLSTTVGAVPGIIGVPLTGVLFDITHSWMASLFLPSILILHLGDGRLGALRRLPAAAL